MILTYIIFGLVKKFTEETITNATLNKTVDLMSSKLPVLTFEFTSIDIGMDYNPENATGLWQYIEQSQDVHVEYGYELDDGEIEWLTGANLKTTGEIKSNSNGGISMVTFYATSSLEQFNSIYEKGSTIPHLLVCILWQVTFSHTLDLPILPSGGDPYYLDPELMNIYTNMPLPELPIKEILQLIANAGMCVLYVDRNGCINIRRLTETLQDFTLGFSSMKTIPVVTKIPELHSIETGYTEIIVDSVESSLSKNKYRYCRSDSI